MMLLPECLALDLCKHSTIKTPGACLLNFCKVLEVVYTGAIFWAMVFMPMISLVSRKMILFFLQLRWRYLTSSMWIGVTAYCTRGLIL